MSDLRNVSALAMSVPFFGKEYSCDGHELDIRSCQRLEFPTGCAAGEHEVVLNCTLRPDQIVTNFTQGEDHIDSSVPVSFIY